MTRHYLPALVAAVLIGSLVRPTIAAEPSDDEVRFFETHIRPVLANRCFKCHGEEKQKGALRLDGLNTILVGGDSGAAVVPGKPDESLLIEAVRYESFEMPPGGQLPDEEIALLAKWVEMGAPWPAQDRNVAMPTSGSITDEDREFWAFQPMAVVDVPDVADPDWSRNSIDQFIWQRLDDNQLAPSPPAGRLTLVRRVYQDLIGLPPTPEQIDAFLSDESPDAYTHLVEQLLESPRYGEHWATFWLDLVRYADSDGFKADFYRPNAWRYRDYVIQAFNDDKPYDRFVLEQLAGDEFFPEDPEALAATGYLRNGIYEYNQRDAFTQWQDLLNDITDTTGDVFLAMGMGCARCHDHKFDPILQKDYYGLQAFFSGIVFRDDVPLATAQQLDEYHRQLADWERQTAEIRAQIDALEKPKLDRLRDQMVAMFPKETQEIMAKPETDRSPHERQIAHLVHLQVIDKQQQLASKFKGDEKEKWDELNQQLAQFDELKPKPLPAGQTASDVGQTAAVVHIPGKERVGQIAPQFLTVLSGEPVDVAPLPTSPQTTGRRAALAQWLVRPDHPLTARVIVNRIWQQHFGTGIVATVSDFGSLGERPSHPDLLDWLAVSFVENGWSLKWLHRQIVTSQTYRQESVVETGTREIEIDPGNRLLWRQNIRRLTAEQIRDAVLAVSGQLSPANGGPPQDASASDRRSVYTKILRNSRDPLLDVFDLPDRITGSGTRNITTTPAQSLLMINSQRLLKPASAFAQRVESEIPGSDDSQIRLAYRLAYGRDPSEQELRWPTRILETGNDDNFRTFDLASQDGLVEMPATGGKAALVDPEDESSLFRSSPDQTLPTKDFTIEAVVLLESLYPDASVRTIASQWNGEANQPGWSLGVTSTNSKYKPRNLILQLVGMTPGGRQEYEVVASGLHLDLEQPYYVAVCVDLERTDESGVTFYVRRLGAAEESLQVARVKHNVTGAYTNDWSLLVGGRDSSTSHRWHGLIDEVRVSARCLEQAELFVETPETSDSVLGWWRFETNEQTVADESGAGQPLVRVPRSSDVSPWLVDLCHVLLNSNEFLYVD